MFLRSVYIFSKKMLDCNNTEPACVTLVKTDYRHTHTHPHTHAPLTFAGKENFWWEPFQSATIIIHHAHCTAQ